MRSSGSSSATPTISASPNPSKRNGFALTGPSVALDPLRNAVRPDLADVRLAGRVFAPHFAAALPRRAAVEADMTAARDGGAVVARLSPGDAFELFDVGAGRAWGVAVEAGIVGYLDADALEKAA